MEDMTTTTDHPTEPRKRVNFGKYYYEHCHPLYNHFSEVVKARNAIPLDPARQIDRDDPEVVAVREACNEVRVLTLALDNHEVIEPTSFENAHRQLPERVAHARTLIEALAQGPL
jgi:hypothetical protein